MRHSFVCVPLALLIAVSALPAAAEVLAPDSFPYARERNLSGPRIGATVALSGGMRRDWKDREIGPAISQFGWHLERQVSPEGPGPSFLVETVLLAGGVEYGQLVPNGTLMFGMRTQDGFEFGVGPSVTLGGSRFASSAVVFAAGRSFRLNGISIPLNLALSTNRDGQRLTLITGWAIRDRPGTEAPSRSLF